jgi:lipopolysaccharide transport system permease protein
LRLKSVLEPGREDAAVAESNPVAQAEATDGLHYYGARPAWRLIDLRELWKHRELLWILAHRDLTVRYRQTLVGVAWAIIQPTVTMVIFLTLFGLLGRQPAPGEIPYALVVLCGLLTWQLFASTLNVASSSLVASQHLIGKVYFPRLILPLAAPAPGLVDFGVGLVLLASMMAIYGVVPSWRVVCLPLFVALAALAGLAPGIGAAALHAMYRDTGILVGFVLQIGFFVSPVIYVTTSLIPGHWTWIYELNPLCGAIEGVRWAVLGTPFPLRALGCAVGVVSVVLVVALAYFRRVEGFVADRI